MVYVEAVPVRVHHLGGVERVGLLLRARPDGTISRSVVSGRVLYGETLRKALWRHLSKDLGPDAEPLRIGFLRSGERDHVGDRARRCCSP